jgi:hypothetical protein
MKGKTVFISTRILLGHKLKLEDVARHDGVTRSALVRQAIARLLSARSHTVYGHLTCKVKVKDSFGQYRKCTDPLTHDKHKENDNDKQPQ